MCRKLVEFLDLQ
jgi:hypothetical protein